MYEISLIIHIISMISSLVLMSGAVGAGIFGKKVAMRIAAGGMYATGIGTLSGIGLLLDNPLSMQCAMLTAYLVSVTLVYYFGFGFGRIENARLVRQS